MLGLGNMMNNWMHLVNDQSGLRRIAELGTMAEVCFLQMEWTWESVRTDLSRFENWHT